MHILFLLSSLSVFAIVEAQLQRIGSSPILNQIIKRLKTFDCAAARWNEGDFSYSKVNANYSLRISPETRSTMSNYGSERTFRLPNGKSEEFSLHIKTGILRFHFFPDNAEKKIYIGYIGPHLNTVSG